MRRRLQGCWLLPVSRGATAVSRRCLLLHMRTLLWLLWLLRLLLRNVNLLHRRAVV